MRVHSVLFSVRSRQKLGCVYSREYHEISVCGGECSWHCFSFEAQSCCIAQNGLQGWVLLLYHPSAKITVLAHQTCQVGSGCLSFCICFETGTLTAHAMYSQTYYVSKDNLEPLIPLPPPSRSLLGFPEPPCLVSGCLQS